MNYTEWRQQALGRPIDIDKHYGNQCVDVYLDYIQKVIGVANWWEVSGYGNAKDLLLTFNPKYFDRLPSRGLPQQGDVIFYGGTAGNPDGHVAIVDNANNVGVSCIEQNGLSPNGTCYQKFRAWNGNCTGWLRPKNNVIVGGEEMIETTDQAAKLYRMLRPNGGGSESEINGTAGRRSFASFLNDAQPEIAGRDASLQTLSNQLANQQDTINKLNEAVTGLKNENVSLRQALAESKALIAELQKPDEPQKVTEPVAPTRTVPKSNLITKLFEAFVKAKQKK